MAQPAAARGTHGLLVAGAGDYTLIAGSAARHLRQLGHPLPGVRRRHLAGPGGRRGHLHVANVQAGTGGDRYAGWTLVVAYGDPTEPLRNLTVYDGFSGPSGAKPISLNVTDFRTPATGTVGPLGFVAYEGDPGLTGDGASLNGTPLFDALNPSTNFFNSTITRSAGAA